MKKTTLADNLPECSAAAAGFGDFFSGLLETTAAKTIDDALGQQIRAYVLGWLQTHPLTAFDDYSDTAYRRTYLGRCPATGWEAIVMSWKTATGPASMRIPNSRAITLPTAPSGSKYSNLRPEVRRG